MKLSTRARYGLRIMIQIAAEDERERPVLARELSEEQDITPAYVDQILIPLRQNGLVISFRGRHGGYKLGRAPEEISALEVVETLEGDLSLVDCVDDKQACSHTGACLARDVWVKLSRAVRDALSQYSMADLTSNGYTESETETQQLAAG